MPDLIQERLARLTEGQRQCLELVARHMSSKEIASVLGISSHTVDQRVRQALQTLKVERRGEAARLLIESRGLDEAVRDPYQRLIHQSPHIDDAPDRPQQSGTVGTLIRHADRAGEAGSSGVISEQKPADHRPSLPLPFATRSQPSNEMSVAMRLLWIMAIAIGAAFSAGMYLAGLESLSRMIAR